MTLERRVAWLLTGSIAVLLVIGAQLWTTATRHAVHEEVRAATRVAEQWLDVLIPETLRDAHDGEARLMQHLVAVGRLRANRMEVRDAGGNLLHVSHEPVWKAGRDAPAWFAAHLTPRVEGARFDAGTLSVELIPDTSRAVLDAWDDLVAAAGWAGLTLVVLWLCARAALRRALAPLLHIDAALREGAKGRFDNRLPHFGATEIDRLVDSYNRLADTLDDSRARNRRLERDQAFARALQTKLEEERRVIARELHDELGQGITAVRAITGSILQRPDTPAAIHGSAQAMLAMTSQMQDGVRTILQRLRGDEDAPVRGLEQAFERYCAHWRNLHPDVALHCLARPIEAELDGTVALALMRLLQESLTNVARHAAADRVEVSLTSTDDRIELRVRDNGNGMSAAGVAHRYGITGMRERVDALHGELHLETPAEGGLCVRAVLPLHDTAITSRANPNRNPYPDEH